MGLGADEPLKDVVALRVMATEVVDYVEKRLKETPELPVVEVMYALKCLKHAGRDMNSWLEAWHPQGAFAVKECNKMLKYLEEEYGKESKAWERFKARCLEIFPLMIIA